MGIKISVLKRLVQKIKFVKIPLKIKKIMSENPVFEKKVVSI